MNRLHASWKKYVLDFRFTAKTSRDELKTRTVWYLILKNPEGKIGIGEAAMLKGLSLDDRPGFEDKLDSVCKIINEEGVVKFELGDWPSLKFALETALLDLHSDHPFKLFPGKFTNAEYAIPINGLVWMGDKKFMKSQLQEKIEAGFKCIKMKIGAISWEDEYEILCAIRDDYSREEIELRVDANGAFAPDKVMPILEKLSKLDIHSIEQPIRAGQWEVLSEICQSSPIPIALDEELIPLLKSDSKLQLFENCRAQYLVLKPSLLGGFASCEEWIELAKQNNCDYWITSALESNIGLNAIAQWVSTLQPKQIYQGLGTGQLFHNNIDSPLEIKNAALCYNSKLAWDIKFLEI